MIILIKISYLIAENLTIENLNFLNKILNSKIREAKNPSSLIIIVIERLIRRFRYKYKIFKLSKKIDLLENLFKLLI